AVLLVRPAAADDLKPVKVGNGVLSGTVTLKEGLKLPIDELNAELKKKIDKNTNKNACKEAYQQRIWLVDRDSRGVHNVPVWLMPEEDNEFFDVKELAVKSHALDQILGLDQH